MPHTKIEMMMYAWAVSSDTQTDSKYKYPLNLPIRVSEYKETYNRMKGIDDSFDEKDQLSLRKQQLEFGINSRYNIYKTPRNYEKEIEVLRKIIRLQKSIISKIKSTYSFFPNDDDSYYLIESDWVNRWKKVVLNS